VTDEQNLVAAGSAGDLAHEEMRLVTLPCGRPVAVYNLDGRFYATDDTCSHGQASLTDEGMIIEGKIHCGWHGGSFDIKTGEACDSPCVDPIRSWSVVERDGELFLDAGQNG
jgi:p-cumate 2,3-dioxygenase ferredoxin subunit